MLAIIVLTGLTWAFIGWLVGTYITGTPTLAAVAGFSFGFLGMLFLLSMAVTGDYDEG